MPDVKIGLQDCVLSCSFTMPPNGDHKWPHLHSTALLFILSFSVSNTCTGQKFCLIHGQLPLHCRKVAIGSMIMQTLTAGKKIAR